jgi:hypothetical protein
MTSYATIYDSVRGGMICIGVIPVDPEVVDANSNKLVEVELPGARVGDVIFVTAPINIDAGIVLAGAQVSGDDEVTFNVRNVTAGEISCTEKEWQIMILKRQTPGGCDPEDDDES